MDCNPSLGGERQYYISSPERNFAPVKTDYIMDHHKPTIKYSLGSINFALFSMLSITQVEEKFTVFQDPWKFEEDYAVVVLKATAWLNIASAIDQDRPAEMAVAVSIATIIGSTVN